MSIAFPARPSPLEDIRIEYPYRVCASFPALNPSAIEDIRIEYPYKVCAGFPARSTSSLEDIRIENPYGCRLEQCLPLYPNRISV